MQLNTISKEKELTETLKQKELSLSALINNTEDIILSIDKNFNLTEFNQNFNNISFHNRFPQLGESVFNFINKQHHEKLKNIYLNVLQGNKQVDIETFISNDGKDNYYFENTNGHVIEFYLKFFKCLKIPDCMTDIL